MKRFILPALVSLSTVASVVTSAPVSATVNSNSKVKELTELTTSDADNLPQIQSQATDTELAYNYCYWETYYDGSTYWVCW